MAPTFMSGSRSFLECLFPANEGGGSMAKPVSKHDLIHIRVGKGMKDLMQELIDSGMFSSEAEITREAIRSVIRREEEFE